MTFVGKQHSAYALPNLESCLVSHAKLNLYFPDCHRLDCTEHVYCPQPILERHFRVPKYGADRYGKLTTTGLAPVQTVAVRLLHAAYLCDGGPSGGAAGIWTHRTIRPPECLKRHAGGGLVSEDGIGVSAGHKSAVSELFSYVYTTPPPNEDFFRRDQAVSRLAVPRLREEAILSSGLKVSPFPGRPRWFLKYPRPPSVLRSNAEQSMA